jgi:hypothetical protein
MPREPRSKEPDHPGMASVIEYDNAATSGHPDDPVPGRPNSRSAVADTKRAALKATGAMSLSKKIDPETKVSGARASSNKSAARSDGMKRSAGAKSADKALDKGSVKADGADSAQTRVKKSNVEIAEGVTSTARKSPAPRSSPIDGGTEMGAAGGPRGLKRTGGTRQRVPAPGNVVLAPKGRLIRGTQPEEERPTASTGGAKPPKRSARAGGATGAAKSKGADQGVSE